MKWSPTLPMGTALEGGEGGELDTRVSRWNKTSRRECGPANMEPAMCNGHLPYPWGRC